MRSVSLLLLVMMLCGDAEAFRPRPPALPGPSVTSGGASTVMWNAFFYDVGAAGPAVNTVLAQFKTGSAASSTLATLFVNAVLVVGTGTETLAITNTGGAVQCSINVSCATGGNISTSTACSAALLPSTVYQLRQTADCTTGGMLHEIGAAVTTTNALMWASINSISAFSPNNSVVGQFKTGNSQATATEIYYTTGTAFANGTGVGTFDLTDASGNALSPACSINVDCTALAGIASTATCGTTLTANTVYNIRNKTACGGASAATPNIAVRVTTP